jgi:hypothetical protein
MSALKFCRDLAVGIGLLAFVIPFAFAVMALLIFWPVAFWSFVFTHIL